MAKHIALGIVLAALAVGYTLYQFVPALSPGTVQELRTYRSEMYGFSFSYPDGYVLGEREVGTGERGHYVITLTRQVDLPPPEAGEGPATITIDVYQNNIEQVALEEWLTGTNFSNFKLSDGTYEETLVAGARAVRYHWSGLYEANTVAFAHGDSIIAVSGMYLAPDDAIVGDFESVVASLELR